MKIKLYGEARMPTRGHADDAGLDLYSMSDGFVFANEHAVFDTGVSVAIPKGYFGLVVSKSSLMARGISCRGVIDSGYRGTIKAVLFNHSNEAYVVRKGDKVTQLVLIPIITPELELVDTLDETERGMGGFGSTGR